MADGGRVQARLVPQKPAGFQNRLMSSSRFRNLAERIPGIRRLVKRDGAALFDVMAGFCHSQILMALAELRIPDALMGGPQTVSTLASECQMPERRMDILVQAGASIGILKRSRGKVSLTRKGAAFASVPGLSAMVRHHRAFYRDLQDPVAFFRGEVETELAEVWPYVFDPSGHIDPTTASAYSDLMAQSQHLVAADTLRMVDFSKIKNLLDVGGGTGAFLEAAGKAHPHLSLHLFDLPTVALDAQARFDSAGFGDRARISTGSFRTDPLPQGADAISLVRVLYDHSDQTVTKLLSSVFDALPPGGRLIVSEPMSGGDHPDRATDGYFALYTMAMRTGETRSPDKIGAMMSHAGFEQIKAPRTFRNYVTSVVTAVKPI